MERASTGLMRDGIKRPGPNFDAIREALPDLAGASDKAIRARYADLHDVAVINSKCRGCKSFVGCWRDEITAGQVLKVIANGDRIEIVSTTCKPFREHTQRVERDGRLDIATFDQSLTFENYPKEQADYHTELYEFVREFAEKYTGGSDKGAFLFGPPGIGKTHMMQALANRLRERKVEVGFVRADKMVNRLRDGAKEKGTVEFLTNLLCKIPVLCIDEFGQEYATEFSLRKILQVFDTRLSAGLPTFMTSNYSPPEVYAHLYSDLKNLIDPLRSRLYLLSRPAPMTGEDHRMNGLDDILKPGRRDS